jgi:hypothetical protein
MDWYIRGIFNEMTESNREIARSLGKLWVPNTCDVSGHRGTQGGKLRHSAEWRQSSRITSSASMSRVGGMVRPSGSVANSGMSGL